MVSFVLLALAVIAAVIDWVAVLDKDQRLEYLCKPLTMVLLIAVALAIDPDSEAARTWFVVALIFSLAGDVFLMLKGRDLFILGLAAFFLAHLAYVFGFIAGGLSFGRMIGGLVVAGVAVGLVGMRIVKAVHEKEPDLGVPVMAYMGVISVMLVVATGSGSGFALLGGLLFYVSDALIGWTRFVKDIAKAPLLIIVTYHVAQICLVASLT